MKSEIMKMIMIKIKRSRSVENEENNKLSK